MTTDTGHPAAHRPWGIADPKPYVAGDVVWLYLLDKPTHLRPTLHVGEVISERDSVVCIRVGCRRVQCDHDDVRPCVRTGRAA